MEEPVVEIPPEKGIKEESRVCSGCGRLKKLDSKHFPHIKGAKYAFQNICRKCIHKLAVTRKLDRVEEKALSDFVSLSIKPGSNLPMIEDFLEACMMVFGGVGGFASLVGNQFFKAKPGDSKRNSLIMMLGRIMEKYSEQEGVRRPLSHYTEAELEREINSRLEGIVVSIKKRSEPHVESEPQALPAPGSGSFPEYEAGGSEVASCGVEGAPPRSLATLRAQSQATCLPRVHGEHGTHNGRESMSLGGSESVRPGGEGVPPGS